MLQPRFKGRSIWFPDRADWLDEMKNELAGVTNYEIKSEYIDLVDSLCMHEQMNRAPVVIDQTTSLRERYLPRMAVK
jgi:hypothetical protein